VSIGGVQLIDIPNQGVVGLHFAGVPLPMQWHAVFSL